MSSLTPHWDGIADSSVQAEAVWLYRPVVQASTVSDTATGTASAPIPPLSSPASAPVVWKPMRKLDCQALNRALIPSTANNSSTVYTEGGRSTADVSTNKLRYNFVRGPERELCHAVWFAREEKSSGGKESIILHPVTDSIDAALMETLYQKAVVAMSSFGPGIASLLADEVPLHSGQAKIQLSKMGDVLTLRKIPTSSWQIFTTTSVVLQRGYGAYTVPGEDVETALGPVRHVMFVVHGIGEALFSRDDIKVSGLIDQVNMARMELQRKQLVQYQKECHDVMKRVSATTVKAASTASGVGTATIAAATTAGSNATPLPAPPARIELIPVEWYHRMHDRNSDLMKSLQATTLGTIPALRAIANDVVFDVLMYLTPAFCQSVLETVTHQINEVYHKFQVVHPDFIPSGGTVSLAGHSLGSVICWDLLALLKQQQEQGQDTMSPTVQTTQLDQTIPHHVTAASLGENAQSHVFQPACCTASAIPDEKVPSAAAPSTHSGDTNIPMPAYGPSLLQPLTQTIAFVPEHTLFLGSPLGLFLTLRGAHAYFDAVRMSDEASPAVSPFLLPTKRLYNIFHPSDPVAYRIEPLLMGMDADNVPPPMYLTVPGGEVRLHVKAMQLGDVVRKSLFDSKRNGASSWGSLTESLGRHIIADQSKSGAEGMNKNLTFPLGGKSGRVDFCLQPGLIENDYISAVTAHSSYFAHSDIQDFLIGLFAAEDEMVTTARPPRM